MDPKDQIIFQLNQDLQKIKSDNNYLRDQLKRASKGQPIEVQIYYKFPNQYPSSKQNQLPSLSSAMSQTKSDIPLNKIAQEFKQESKRLLKENQELLNGKELAQQQFKDLQIENDQLQTKLQNLQNVFVTNNESVNEVSNKESEDLKIQIAQLEQENQQFMNLVESNQRLFQLFSNNQIEDQYQFVKAKELNQKLIKQYEDLQKRERELQQKLQSKL